MYAVMTLSVLLKIPNTGPPEFKSKPKDIRIKIGDKWPLKVANMKDPDWEDTPKLSSIDFGKALTFITGSFPDFLINPVSNATDPGLYPITVVITDDNPSPLESKYSFKIIVESAPPSPSSVVLVSQKNET